MPTVAQRPPTRTRLGAHLTFVPRDPVPAAGVLALWGVDEPDEVASALGLPAGDEGGLQTVEVGDDGEPRGVTVSARLLPLIPAVRVLAAFPAVEDWPAWRRPSASVLAWSVAAKLALDHVTGGHLIPSVQASEAGAPPLACWRAVPTADGRVAALARAFPQPAHALRREDGLWPAEELLRAFLDAVADACGRAGRRAATAGTRPRHEQPWREAWSEALAGDDPRVVHRGDAPDPRQVTAWTRPALGFDARAGANLSLRLEAPEPDTEQGGFATASGPWRLHLALCAADDPEHSVPAGEVWRSPEPTVRLAGREVLGPHRILARGLVQAARLFPPLERALDERAPTHVDLDIEQAASFLGEAAEALRTVGIGVELPTELAEAELLRPQARIRLLGVEDTTDPGRTTRESTGVFTTQSLTDFRFEVALGDETLSGEQFRQLAELHAPLVQFQGQWVRVDRDELEQLADLDGETGQLGLREALVAALAGEHQLPEGGRVEAVADGELAKLIDRLREAGQRTEPDTRNLTAELRAYQERGVAWLQSLGDLGVGAVLADSMGLGKTVQAIGLLASRQNNRPHLVVCPTSVVGNWERELSRFAPNVEVVRYHGPDRPETIDAFPPGSVAVTSYGLLRRDVDLLSAVDWDVVVFDEAQQVKNVASKGARCARSLRARLRVAMTGTPMENRLSELWAIVDLTNPGLLGPLRRFTERYAVPIERWHDPDAAERLRRLVAPFILRREKGDPQVSLDLPEKSEITVPCTLSREQAALYQAAVDRAFSGGRIAGEGIARRGRILALLTALKQICNHPAHYLGEEEPLAGRSGKLDRCTEILSELVDAGEHALVFTQFTRMGELLQAHLREALDLPEVPFLHGGMARQTRDRLVGRFQEDEDAPPILVVSLRAGGQGLNLTRATEVVHYDRWWNPAVEDQAADRTHRIGQTRGVTVHTLVAGGTVEDRIADLLERKRRLADAVVGAGESWITELGDSELHDLVALSSDDVADEELEEVS